MYKSMNAQEIRRAYLDFAKKNGHVIVPRANLVPDNDPTTLFTGSGMQPLLPYLLGEPHPAGSRVADSQTCFRSDDIEEVGDNRHTTFFEMLGNWSFGDYFKAEQLPWFFTFLTDIVGLDPKKIYVTVFAGDRDFQLPQDDESVKIWQKLFNDKNIDAKAAQIGSEADGYKRGIKPGERIFYYDGSKNWWSRGGKPANTPIGDPCGPDSEVFYLFDDVAHDPSFGKNCHPNCDCGRFMEIGNSVFMTYKRTERGFEELPNKNVDFGGGLERIAAAAIDSSDMFKISLLWPIIESLEKKTGKKYDDHTAAMRVIADHLRVALFLAVDGVTPSNKEQGYVMRRLIRRAIRFAFDLGIEQDLMKLAVPIIADCYHEDFPEIASRREELLATLQKEEKVFRGTLTKGIREFKKLFENSDERNHGELIFKLYDTYGFPMELSVEEAKSQNIELAADWHEQYDAHMALQRELSRTATKGQFKGGLGGQSHIHRKYHTATHLMYQALRDVLGDHVIQRGSNITEERLRFDFSHDQKLTPEQISQVENIVNEQIAHHLVVTWHEYPTDVAINEKHALGQFGDRYGDIVKVYNMQADGAKKPFSFEICGGPHVDNTEELEQEGKHFKILKEEASSAGVRRIKAALV